MNQIPPDHLYSLRNDVDVADVIDTLGVPTARRGSRVTFHCPDCGDPHAAMNLNRNLAYCFRCERSFNTIDLVMAQRNCTFLEAVEFLETLLG